MRPTFLIACIMGFVISTSGQIVDSFKTSDGETLYMTRHGTGPSVILLSGGPGTGVDILIPWAMALKDGYECILFDQRGTGLSSKAKLDSTTINLKRATEDIDDLRKYLGEKQLTICGISWGAMLAQAYVSYFPENASKIILVSTLGQDLSLWPAYRDNLIRGMCPDEKDSLEYWNNQPDSDLSNMKRQIFSAMPYYYDRNIVYEKFPGLIAHSTQNSKMSGLMWEDCEKNYDLSTKLRNFKGQCIIIQPRQDPFPKEGIYQIKEAVPQTRIIRIERCGHRPDFEKPEEFFKILRE